MHTSKRMCRMCSLLVIVRNSEIPRLDNSGLNNYGTQPANMVRWLRKQFVIIRYHMIVVSGSTQQNSSISNIKRMVLCRQGHAKVMIHFTGKMLHGINAFE